MTDLSDVRRGLDNISVYAVPEGEPKPIRIKLARISYLKAGKMVLLPKEDEK